MLFSSKMSPLKNNGAMTFGQVAFSLSLQFTPVENNGAVPFGQIVVDRKRVYFLYFIVQNF